MKNWRIDGVVQRVLAEDKRQITEIKYTQSHLWLLFLSWWLVLKHTANKDDEFFTEEREKYDLIWNY